MQLSCVFEKKNRCGILIFSVNLFNDEVRVLGESANKPCIPVSALEYS